MKKIAVLTLSAAILLISYDTYKNSNKTQRGAVIGTAGGVLLGTILGNNIGDDQNNELGAILDTIVGGTADAIIGNQMDKQAKKIEEETPGTGVKRVDDDIAITFDKNSSIYFETTKHNINEKSKKTLNELIAVFKGYPETDVVVAGYTDSVDKDEYNMGLSKRRVQSVTNYLTSNGLATGKFTIKWFGEQDPVTDNDIPEDHAKSRRVNIVIIPNERMKANIEGSANQN